MKIKDIMSKKLITCSIDDNILFVSNLMKINDVGFILIKDKNKLYGIVTDRDIVCALPNGTNPIKEIARTNIISTDENKTIEEGLNTMKENKIKRLVITNKNKITGVLSLSDIYQTNINSNDILNTLKEIYTINHNDENYNTDVDDFIL